MSMRDKQFYKLLPTSTTHDYVAERVVQIKKPAHISHIEFSFHLSLFRPSETLWFGRDNGTTVLAYLLYSMKILTQDLRVVCNIRKTFLKTRPDPNTALSIKLQAVYAAAAIA